jgi:hypothetical protein
MEYSNLFTKNVLVSSLVLEPSITNIPLNECEKRSEQFIVGGISMQTSPIKLWYNFYFLCLFIVRHSSQDSGIPTYGMVLKII